MCLSLPVGCGSCGDIQIACCSLQVARDRQVTEALERERREKVERIDQDSKDSRSEKRARLQDTREKVDAIVKGEPTFRVFRHPLDHLSFAAVVQMPVYKPDDAMRCVDALRVLRAVRTLPSRASPTVPGRAMHTVLCGSVPVVLTCCVLYPWRRVQQGGSSEAAACWRLRDRVGAAARGGRGAADACGAQRTSGSVNKNSRSARRREVAS